MTMLLIHVIIDHQLTILLIRTIHQPIHSAMSKNTTAPSTEGRGRNILHTQHIMTAEGTWIILGSNRIVVIVTPVAITIDNIHHHHILSILVQMITLLDVLTHLVQDQDLRFVIPEIGLRQVERIHIIQSGINLVMVLIEMQDQNIQVEDQLMNMMIDIDERIPRSILDQ
jgi:hypothetical protein